MYGFMVLYTDDAKLQDKLTKTFRRAYKFESLSSIKQRNKEIYWWSRNLRELVGYYGITGWGLNRINDEKYNICHMNQKGPFYLCISRVKIIPQVMIRFNGPVSTAKSYDVINRFTSRDGMIISLDNMSYGKSYNLRCFDCRWLSNYAGQDEYFWMNGDEKIRIQNIIIIKNPINFNNFFRSLYYFDAMITGINIEQERANKIRASDIEILSKFIDNKLNNNKIENIPKYMIQLFHNYIDNKTQLIINLIYLEQYFEKITSLIMQNISRKTTDPSKDNLVKPNMVTLFKNLQSIVLITTGWNDDGGNFYEYIVNIPHLLLTIRKIFAITNIKQDIKMLENIIFYNLLKEHGLLIFGTI